MNSEELIQFNPILAKALADVEAVNRDPHVPKEILRELVATAVKAGISPDKIYAVIKTGRILTIDNMKFLSENDIKEWQDAAREYDRLANTETPASEEGKAMPMQYKVEIEVTIEDEQQAIRVARKLYAEGAGATEPVDDNSEEERLIPPEEYIDDIEAALLDLVHSNPLLEQAGIEVTGLTAGRIQATKKQKVDEH